MKVICLKVDKDLIWKDCEKYMDLLTEDRKSKCLRYINEEKRIVSLLSSLLIKKEAGNGKDIAFTYNQYGKPYIKQNPNLFFSVSHSDEYITYVQDKQEIGIDIEKIKEFNLKVAKKFFTPEENDYLSKSKTLNIDSYKIWTQKEAYLKKIGTGFAQGGLKINVLEPMIQQHLKTVQIDNYMLTIATTKQEPTIEIVKLSSTDFINNLQ